MMVNTLYQVLKVLCLCACACGTCTPNDVKDDLTQCLMNNHMGTYYQFPIVTASNYRNLCYNISCLSYCHTLVASPCSSLEFMTHLGNGDALSAAYLGLCDQTEADVTAALSCGSTVSNQNALNTISAFQTSLQTYYTTSSENTTVICAEWITMKDGLDALIAAAGCSGTALTNWNTFLNTVAHECDNSLTPSWYTTYRETSDHRCSGTESLMQSVTLLLLIATVLFWKIT